MTADVNVYAEGLGRASICVPKDQPEDVTMRHMNTLHHPGTSHGWQPSTDETFLGGQPNPCPCDRNPDRIHMLLDC